MNLFRKATATAALVTLVSGMFSTGVSAYSNGQYTAAKDLAAGGYINSHADASGFNLDQNVLRQEIAKVAAGIASVSPKTSCSDSFSDVSATTPNTWACSYAEALLDAKLVSANAKFNPETNITKAEAVKLMLSAAGYTGFYSDVSKWQEETVAFAANEGIVNSFTDYNTPATRGFVFEAANEAMNANSGDQSLNDIIGGLLGDDTSSDTTDTSSDTTDTSSDTTDTSSDTTDTSSDTTADTTVSGNGLEVGLSPDSLADGTQVPNVGTVRFGKVDFTAGSEDASLNTVEISKTTLASIPSSTRVWFEKDGKRISGKAAFSSDNTAIVSFAPSYVVKAGETATLDLYVELNTSAGNDFQFTGKVIDASVSSEGMFTTPLLSTATYTVASARVTAFTTNASYTDLSTAVELGKFSVKNGDTSSETRDMTFQSITLRQTGDADLANLDDVYLERLGTKVSTSYTTDGKYITFNVNDTIKDATTATYYIK